MIPSATSTSAGFYGALGTANAARLSAVWYWPYLRRTSGYSRTQITRLVARWDENVSLRQICLNSSFADLVVG